MHIAASNPLALSQFNRQPIIDKEQELVTEELKNMGKTEDIAKKLALVKWRSLKRKMPLTQAWVMEPKKVQDVLKELAINDWRSRSLAE